MCLDLDFDQLVQAGYFYCHLSTAHLPAKSACLPGGKYGAEGFPQTIEFPWRETRQ